MNEGVLKLKIAKLKKLIAMLKLGGSQTKAETEKYQKEVKDLETELAKLPKK